jgi:Brp/Blh family beta-carotene 15,15'-monooxygenase
VTGWKTEALEAHARLTTFAAMAITAVVLVWGAPPMSMQIVACVALVAVLGLPHGAVDLDVARRRWAAVRGLRGALLFVAGYVAVAGLVVAIWLIAPAASLLVFLGISAWHFGRSECSTAALDRRRSAGETLAAGAFPIALPAAFHANDVAAIFTALMTNGTVFEPPTVRAIALPAAAATLFVLVIAERRASSRSAPAHIGARVALIACLIFCPPLVAFTVYFCGWHSIREILSEAAQRNESSPRRGLATFARAAAPATLASIAGAALVVPFASSGSLNDAALRIVFVGLAALTVPHMLIHGERPLWPGREVMPRGFTRSF